jgi:hypothetical protein
VLRDVDVSASCGFSRLLPEQGVCRFEKAQIGGGGGKALSDTE